MKRNLMAVAIVASLLALTAACSRQSENRIEGLISIRSHAGVLEYAACFPGPVSEIRVEVRNTALQVDWHRVWVASGDGELEAEAAYAFGDAPEGMNNAVEDVPASIVPGDEIMISLVRGVSGPVDRTFFGPLQELPPDNSWLHSDGTSAASPCE